MDTTLELEERVEDWLKTDVGDETQAAAFALMRVAAKMWVRGHPAGLTEAASSYSELGLLAFSRGMSETVKQLRTQGLGYSEIFKQTERVRLAYLSALIDDPKEVFDAQWLALSEQGTCDSLGGMEFERVKQEWEDCREAGRHRGIHRQASQRRGYRSAVVVLYESGVTGASFAVDTQRAAAEWRGVG